MGQTLRARFLIQLIIEKRCKDRPLYLLTKFTSVCLGLELREIGVDFLLTEASVM